MAFSHYDYFVIIMQVLESCRILKYISMSTLILVCLYMN